LPEEDKLMVDIQPQRERLEWREKCRGHKKVGVEATKKKEMKTEHLKITNGHFKVLNIWAS